MAPQSTRRGSFTGRKHTPEWIAAHIARVTKWTPEMSDTVRAWYRERDGRKLELDRLAALLGINKHSVCRKARALGLTDQARRSGRKRTAKHATEDDRRAAIGAATRQRLAANGHPRGMLGKKQKPEHVARLAQLTRERAARTTREEWERRTDKAQATLMARYGTLAPGFRKLTNAYSRVKYGRRDDLGGKFFRSAWEANYARFLEWQKSRGLIAGWEYEADTFWFEAIRRGVRSYTPDFKVTENDGSVHYVEVKGWMDAKSKTKIARMAKYHPRVDFRVFGEKAYYELERKLGAAIPGWE